MCWLLSALQVLVDTELLLLSAPGKGVRVVRAHFEGHIGRLVRLAQVVEEDFAILLALHVAQHVLRHRQPPPVLRVTSTALLILERPARQ